MARMHADLCPDGARMRNQSLQMRACMQTFVVMLARACHFKASMARMYADYCAHDARMLKSNFPNARMAGTHAGGW